MNEVEIFLTHHKACREGKEWAVSNCKTMDEVFATAKHEWLIWLITREGVCTDQELRKFACWSVRQIWHLLKDDRSRNAVEVAEKYADGEATQEELIAAWAAARDAARAAAGAAELSAARAAAGAAELSAARAAAWAAARDAARDAARAAARAAAWAAARDAQDKYIRSTMKPNFTLK